MSDGAVVRLESATEADFFTMPDPSAYALTKRLFDFTLAIVAIVATLPLMIVIAVLIRLDSPGPIVFRQQRVGRGGSPFSFYKFRTMWVDARERFPAMYAYRYSEEEFADLLFCKADDPRTTRLGRWLRTTSLDELPNLINVVLGTMSLVGPRPEIPELLPYYRGAQLAKFAVKPGVTCLWQVNGRDLLRRREGIAMDLEYVRRRSLGFDLSILGRTVGTVVARVGAY